jgi:hypothetical protein
MILASANSYRSGSFLTSLGRFTEGQSVRQHQFVVRRLLLELAFWELEVGSAQGVFFPLAYCQFYSIIDAVRGYDGRETKCLGS